MAISCAWRMGEKPSEVLEERKRGGRGRERGTGTGTGTGRGTPWERENYRERENVILINPIMSLSIYVVSRSLIKSDLQA
jgi:hypothetical protein